MEWPKDKQLWLSNWSNFIQHTALHPLKVELVDIDDEHIELRMPINDAVRQPLGALHGGVSMLLAESAASMHASWGLDLSEHVPVGIEISGSHLRSAREGHVRAVARPLRRTHTLIFHEVDIIHQESGQLLCRARVTNYYKPTAKPDLQNLAEALP